MNPHDPEERKRALAKAIEDGKNVTISLSDDQIDRIAKDFKKSKEETIEVIKKYLGK
jgi:hypothetical protein